MRHSVRATATAFTVAAALALAGCSDDSEPERDADGNVTASTDADIFDVQVGDCVGSFGDAGAVEEIPVMPCGQEHEQEVYAAVDVPDGDFPGADELRTLAEEGCVVEFETFVGLPWSDSALDVTWLEPTEESWAEGDRQILCLVSDPAGPVTETLEGAAR